MTKKVLCLYYSNSGQTQRILDHLLQPLRDHADVDLRVEKLAPAAPYPFPWTLLSFFSAFPEAVRETPCRLEKPALREDDRFDLVVLAYPVWFLSVATPMMGFLKSAQARILANTDVVTIVTCRSMWSQAQLSMQKQLRRIGARLVGHVTFQDRSGNRPITFVSTPLWLITGKQKVSKYMPDAGVSPEAIRSAGRFGRAILAHLNLEAQESVAPLRRADALTTTATSEAVGKSIFRAWALLIGAYSKPESPMRKALVILFIAFLCGVALTFLPAWILLVRLGQRVGVAPPTRQVVHFAGK
jgi:hypothetical protein